MPKKWGNVGGIYIGGEGNKEEPTLGEALFERTAKLGKKTESSKEEKNLQKARAQLQERKKELEDLKEEAAGTTEEDRAENREIMSGVLSQEIEHNRGKYHTVPLRQIIKEESAASEKERQQRNQSAKEAGERISAELKNMPVEGTLEMMRKAQDKREKRKPAEAHHEPDNPFSLPEDEDGKEIVRLERDYTKFKNKLVFAAGNKDAVAIVWRKWAEEFETTNRTLKEVREKISNADPDELKLRRMALWLFKVDYEKSARDFIDGKGNLRAETKKQKDAVGPKDVQPSDTTKKEARGPLPEQIDHDIFAKWRARMRKEDVLPLLRETIARFNEVLAQDQEFARKWIAQARFLYDEDIDPKKGYRDFMGGKFASIRMHRAWALDTFLQAADLAFRKNKPIPEDTTYYRNMPAPADDTDALPSTEAVPTSPVGKADLSDKEIPPLSATDAAPTTDAATHLSVEPTGEPEKLKEAMILTGAAASEKKESHLVNQDASYIDTQNGIMGVFDGMGGHASGEVASSEARSALKEGIKDLKTSSDVAHVREKILKIFQRMQGRVQLAFPGKHGREMPGTTATVVKIVQEGGKQIAVVGHIGDSRAYVFRAGTGTLEQITQDDDLLGECPPDRPLFPYISDVRHILSEVNNENALQDQAAFARAFPNLSISGQQDGLAQLNTYIQESLGLRSLSDLFHRRNSISKNIGETDSEPAVLQTEIAPGDIVFCTSDGIHDNLTNSAIEFVLQNNADKNPDQLARILIDVAQSIVEAHILRSKRDDMTVVLLKGENLTVAREAQPAADEPNRVALAESGVENAEITSTQIYKNLLIQYNMARDNDAARRALISGWRESAATARIDTERIVALRHILLEIDAGRLDSSSSDGTAAMPRSRVHDTLFERLYSLKPDMGASRDIQEGDEFNVRIIGTDNFKKAEIEEYNGRKIEIRFPGVKGVIPRQLQMDRVYRIRIIKTNQSKEKRSGGGKHYWHEAEIIGPNLVEGEEFEAKFEAPVNPGVYRTFAPDGLAVFVRSPENLDTSKAYDVVIRRAADFSQTDSKRHHEGYLKELGPSAASAGAAGRTESAPLVWGDLTPEKKAELAHDRELFMQMFPEGIVTRGIFERDDETGEANLLPQGNLDAESCIFLLQRFFDLPSGYIAKTDFVRPGEYKPNALNVDTGFETTGFQVKWFSKDELVEKGLSAPDVSGQKEEDAGGAHVVIVQDHGPDANRTMSAFKLLYDALIDRYGEDAIPPTEREPMKNFVKFVTHIDNFTAPDADFDWEKAWNESDKIPFTLALAKQNFLNVRDVYRFFQRHPFEDAFKRPSEWAVEAPAKLRNGHYDFRGEAEALGAYGFDVLGRKRKDGRQEPIMTEQYKLIEKGNRYFEYLEHNEPEFIVESAKYGKILVVLDGDHVPGRLSSAMAHGINGMLEWRPGAKSFWFNVAPQKDPADFGTPQISHELAEETGGVWVRGSIVMQPDWKKEDIKAGLNLGVFLEKIGVPLDGVRGRLQERVEEESNGKKPWETLPADADFLALKVDLKEEIYTTGSLFFSTADPNQKTVNGKEEKYFLRDLKRPEKFKNYSINIWVMAVHEWFNDQIMNTFMKWMDENIEITSVDAAAGTITERDGTVSNKEQFVERFEALPQIYNRASRGLWKGAVERWFDAVVAGERILILSAPDVASFSPSVPATTPAPDARTRASAPLTPEPARVAPGVPATPRVQWPTFAPPAASSAEPEPTFAELTPATAEGAPIAALEPGVVAAVEAQTEADARTEQSAEDTRIADARAELERVTDRLARARAAKEQYEGVLKGFAGFITGKGSQAEKEYDAALQEYQNATERLIGRALTEGLQWRTRLVEKMIDAQLATPEKKGLGARAVELWKAAGEKSLYNYIDKKGGWRDKRGFVWGTFKVLSKAANLRTATALSLFGGGWIAGATAAGWSMAGAGAGLSAFGSGIGFNEWMRHGYEIGRTSGSSPRAQVFKDQAEAEAHYQAEYAGVGRFKKLWRGLSGQGLSAEGAAAKAVWLEKLGKGNVTTKRKALAERMLAFEADAMLSGKKDLLNDASYQKLAEAYKDAVAAEEQAVNGVLEGYLEAQGKDFVDALDSAIGGEKSALRLRKVFSAFAGATLGLASLANFDVRSFVRGLGSEGKPPAGIVPVENGSVPRVASLPSGSEGVTPRVPSGAPSVETVPATRSPFADLIRGAQGERAWTGVRSVAGGEYAHIVPQKGHRAVIQAVKELLHADPQKFGMSAHPSDALVEAKATAIARKLGFMGHGYSLGFKFDADHPVGLFAKDGQISIVAENEDTLHRLMGAVKRGGGVMKPDAARPYVDSAFPKIRAHAIFVEGQSGAPVNATHIRVSAGVGRGVAPRAEDFGAGRATGASARVSGLRGAGVSTSESLTAGELAPHAGATAGRGARAAAAGDVIPSTRAGGTGIGAPADARAGDMGAGKSRFSDGGGGGADGGGGVSATETVPAVDARPVFVRVIDGVKFEASGVYRPGELARIKELADELARQKTSVDAQLAFLQNSEAGKKLVELFKPKIHAFKDVLETFRHKISEGKTSVRELEDLVNSSPLKETPVPAAEGAGEAAGSIASAGAGAESGLPGAGAVEEGIAKIASASRRIISDPEKHLLSVWNGKTRAAVSLELPDAFEVAPRAVRGEPLAVNILTPGGQRLKGVIKFVEGVARVVVEEDKKKIDMSWEKFLKKY